MSHFSTLIQKIGCLAGAAGLAFLIIDCHALCIRLTFQGSYQETLAFGR
jgi:hypothetical protein